MEITYMVCGRVREERTASTEDCVRRCPDCRAMGFLARMTACGGDAEDDASALSPLAPLPVVATDTAKSLDLLRR